jgi:hypothetical protein
VSLGDALLIDVASHAASYRVHANPAVALVRLALFGKRKLDKQLKVI